MLEYEPGNPRITKDGVTVITSIGCRNNFQNIGMNLLKMISNNSNENSGDGTTSSVILTWKIFEIGKKYVDSGLNPILMCRGIKKAQTVVQDFLKEIKISLDAKKNYKELLQIALISTNHDKEISKLIADAVFKLGPNGQILIEKSNTYKSELMIVEGCSITKGLADISLLEKNKNVNILDKPLILLLNLELNSLELTSKIISSFKKYKNGSFLVFVETISDDCLSQILFQKTHANLKINIVELNFKGSFKEDLFEDLAALLNTNVLNIYSFNQNNNDLNIILNNSGNIIRKSQTC